MKLLVNISTKIGVENKNTDLGCESHY